MGDIAIKIMTHIVTMIVMALLLLSCISGDQGKDKVLGVLYISENALKERSDDSFLTKEDIERLMEEGDEKYYRIKFTSKIANAWWKALVLPETVEGNILNYKGSTGGEYGAEIDKLHSSFVSLDELMRSKYIEGEQLYKAINDYCLSAGTVMEMNSPFPAVDFVMTMGSDYHWLARYFYENLTRPDGTAFESCKL